jgi:hypothetical protein
MFRLQVLPRLGALLSLCCFLVLLFLEGCALCFLLALFVFLPSPMFDSCPLSISPYCLFFFSLVVRVTDLVLQVSVDSILPLVFFSVILVFFVCGLLRFHTRFDFPYVAVAVLSATLQYCTGQLSICCSQCWLLFLPCIVVPICNDWLRCAGLRFRTASRLIASQGSVGPCHMHHSDRSHLYGLRHRTAYVFVDSLFSVSLLSIMTLLMLSYLTLFQYPRCPACPSLPWLRHRGSDLFTKVPFRSCAYFNHHDPITLLSNTRQCTYQVPPTPANTWSVVLPGNSPPLLSQVQFSALFFSLS